MNLPSLSKRLPTCLPGLLAFALSGPGLLAQTDPATELVSLPAFVLNENRIALQGPATSFETPASALRFEPRVDLQTRNFGEAQGDVAIRGGIFEGTAVRVGGLTIFDPQTGHYALELPIPAAMLGAPLVLTGVEHALGGMNATAGTLDYAWRPIEAGGRLAVAAGNGAFRRASLHAAHVLARGADGRPRIATDAEFAHSRADGTIPDGDHEFSRVAGRVEVLTGAGLTRIFAGYQSKFFGWPNLYTPFGVAETESLQTTLALLSHRLEREGRVFETAGYFRRNRDDYEFDRTRPGLFNPFQHETRVTGAMARAELPVGSWTLDLRGEAAADSIESTSLTAGRFDSRTTWRLATAATREWEGPADGSWALRLGGAFDDTNREPSAFSPIVEIAWRRLDTTRGRSLRWYLEASEATRVPGYTALNSSAAGGLFRGNPDLGRENARNLETGFQLGAARWSLHAALFHRRDDPLVDWTFTRGSPNARSAREVAIDTTGLELVAAHTWERVRLVAGYAWLAKRADYFGAEVDASFYALNFPEHRVTVALTAGLGAGFELRMDNEYRVQEPNVLRTVGGDDALLGSIGLFWLPPRAPAVEFSLVVDNLWRSDFQEIPAVPAPGRQITAGVAWRW